MDNENGDKLFARRLIEAGATVEMTRHHLHYVPFSRSIKEPSELEPEIEAIARELPGAFVVFDSMRTFMARFRLDPNKDVDVDQFLGSLAAGVKKSPVGVTIGVIDHSNRTTRAGDDYAAAGSFAKAAVADNVYFFDRVERYNRETCGLVRIVGNDDREGYSDMDRYYRIGGQGKAKGEKLFFERVGASEVSPAGLTRETVREFLAEHEGEGFSLTALRKAIKAPNGDIDAGVKQLADNPRVPVFARRDHGPNRPPTFYHDLEGLEADGDPGITF